MAWFDIAYKCGHEDRVQIYGTNVHGERDRKAAWYGTVDCPACAAVKAAEWNKANGCVALKGSPKQVAWAERIRRDALDKLAAARHEMAEHGETAERLDMADRTIADLKAQTSAAWFIDRR